MNAQEILYQRNKNKALAESLNNTLRRGEEADAKAQKCLENVQESARKTRESYLRTKEAVENGLNHIQLENEKLDQMEAQNNG